MEALLPVATRSGRGPARAQVYAALRDAIVSAQLAPGRQISENELAARLGVSRTPVREALRKLQASGLVEMRPQRGALVRMPSARDVREAYEVRAELEGLAASIAATRIGADELQRLRDAQELFRHSVSTLLERRSGRPPDVSADAHAEWMRANDSFHLAVQEAAGNRRLRSTLAELHQSFPRDLTWIVLGESSHLLEENVAQHEAVLASIERHEPAEARLAMIEHVRSAGELVTRRFEERAG